jgi:hypothetical protein
VTSTFFEVFWKNARLGFVLWQVFEDAALGLSRSLAWLGLKSSYHLGRVAAVEEFALQKSTETRANVGREGLPYAPRAFLRFFITNTFNHRLPAFVVILGAATLVVVD